MSDGKDDRVREVDFIGVLVDGGSDHRRVDDDGIIGCHGIAAQLHAGVLRGQVHADVLVQHESNADLTCEGGGENNCTSEQSLFFISVLKNIVMRF